MSRIFHYLNEVYKERSFSHAAQKLYLSQPSLSLTIKKYEQEIGVQIFDRSTTPIQLTEAGRVYMDGIQQILAIEKSLDAYLDDYKELKKGSLTLGAPQMFASYLLPAMIARFLKRFPSVEMRLIEADFLTLHEMALNGEIDLLVESHPFDETLFNNYPIFDEHILLAVPSSDPANELLKGSGLSKNDIISDLHIASGCSQVSLRHFHNHGFLMLEKGYDMHTRAMRMFRNSDFEPKVFMTLNQLMTVYNMVDQQLGVSFVTDTIVKLTPAGNDIVYYKTDDEKNTRCINLTHKLNRYISKSMHEFIRMMEEICGEGIVAVTSRERQK